MKFKIDAPVAGVDWSRFEVIVSAKDQPVARFKTLAEAAPNYKGYIWVLEATADSFELQNRQIDIDAIDAIEAAGINAFCFNSKYTSLYRIKWNDIAKTDEADAEVIRRIATETPITCSRFKQIVKEDPIRDAIKKILVEDRYLFDGQKSIELAKANLPEYKDVPESFREFLYKPETIKSKNPRKPTPKKQIGRLFMAIHQVKQAGLGWRTLRRQVGNHGQGYGCMLRSEFYWWLVRIIISARLKKLGIEKTTKISHIDPKTKEERAVRIWAPEEEEVKKKVMRQMDKILKWMWKRV